MKNAAFLLVMFSAVSLSAQIEVVSGGNVGIGTTSPASKLHLYQASGGTNHLILDTGFSGGNAIALNPFITGISNGGFEIRDVTNSATHFVIQSATGNVGIGTTNPQFPLDISGPGARITNGNGNAAQLDLVQTTGGHDWALVSWGSGAGGGTLGNKFSIYDNTSGGHRLVIDVSGNVGIGTAIPAAPLHVLGNNAREVARFQGSNDVTDNRNFISIFTTNPGFWWEISNQDYLGGGTQNGLAFRERSGGGTSIERVYFATGGNVGIGTVTPSQKLEVAGSIRATSFIADSNTYADFVFEPDYRLPALSGVEAYIQKEGHLPGIPSETEAKAHGMDLASMQVKLLQKVEELTLHAIAQEKEIEALKKQLADMAH